jgi:hypothetical protein
MKRFFSRVRLRVASFRQPERPRLGRATEHPHPVRKAGSQNADKSFFAFAFLRLTAGSDAQNNAATDGTNLAALAGVREFAALEQR